LDPRAFEIEELAVMIDRLAVQQAAHDVERLVGPAAARARIDAAHRDFVAIFAADADAQDQLSRRRFGNRRELPRDRDRIAQRQQIDADDDLQLRAERRQRRRVDQAVHAGADVKAHMVRHEDVIDAVRDDRVDETLTIAVRRAQNLGGGQRPDREWNVAHDLRRLRAMRNADSCPL